MDNTPDEQTQNPEIVSDRVIGHRLLVMIGVIGADYGVNRVINGVWWAG